ncbi:tyrosine-type recombinase/integrase [Rhodobacter sp. KR11]|uniref:tyrosine-type recombinase/integrase n=1 Tax=Rhodobacter sp. KR11 TaxID=2974588 RepID=UPI00222217EF|nr:tyrosine-type recombinase/integrase [Rhodobacter sp. KR11]MCW1920860.1 tyrosine-type recombinase/integrase [Rhodobacter sp. KR11]
MPKINAAVLEKAFVPAGTPTLGAVVGQIEAHSDLTPTRRRDILSGLRRLAKALNRTLEEIPAHPAWLQKRIEKIAPGAIGISQKTLSNALSDARAGLVLCGIVEGRTKKRDAMDARWQPLWAAVLATHDRSLHGLSRFIRFLNRLGIAPDAVRDEHAEAYLEGLRVNEIGKDPVIAYRAAVNMWNLAQSRVPDWPTQRLTLPSRSKKFALDLAAFPETFQLDLERFEQSLTAPDPFDALARSAPLRSASVGVYRQRLLRFASILVHSGLKSEDLPNIGSVTTPKNVERGLRWMLERNQNKLTREVSEMAGLLANISKRFVHVSQNDQATIERLRDRVLVKPQSGMTDKNRDRLRPLEDQDKVRALLRLPEALFAKTSGDTSYNANLAREDAVAIAIFLHCPIRRGNAVSIHLEENLHRFGKGRAFLLFEADQVKNSERIEFELPASVISLIEQHLALRTPQLCDPGNPWLFPMRAGKAPMDATQFSSRIKARIFKELGIEVNAHLFRHIAAKLFLTARPGQYEALRRLLGHKALTQTINAYAGFEAGTATRLFAEVIAEAKR